MSKIEDKFNQHPMNELQIAKSNQVRTAAIILAKSIENIDDGREKALALTKVEEAAMWANKAIALEGGN